MIDLLFATTNAGKLAELQGLIGPAARVRSLADFPDVPEPVEDAETFEGNAAKKAVEYARATGLPALADDSGLVVEALGGRPGVHSARYVPGSDVDRLHKVLEEMRGVQDRRASFVCALCLALPSGGTFTERGEVEGVLTEAPRGTGGFGYDPIFLVPSLGKTTAELSREEKARISHRGEAFRRMLPTLQTLLEGRLT